MADTEMPRDVQTLMHVREGGAFYLGFDGPPGKATVVNVGIADPEEPGTTIKRSFTPDKAEEIANSMLGMVQAIREGK